MKFLCILFILFSVPRTWAKSYPACEDEEESIEYSCHERSYDSLHQRLKRRFRSKQKIVFKEFLRAKAIQKVEAQEEALNSILDCFEKKLDTSLCLYTKEQAIYDYKLIRKYLGLFHNSTLVDHFEDRDIDKVNSQIRHFDFISKQKLTPLSQSEVAEAVAVFNNEKDEQFLFNELENKPNRKSLISILKYQDGIKEVKESLKKRAREYYIKVSLINPVVTFLSSEKPDDDELYNAYNKLKEKFKRDKELLQKKTFGDLNELFYFSSFINEILSENPLYCDLAEDLTRKYSRDAELEDSALSYGGSLLGLFSGPAGIAGLVLGNGYNVYQKAQSVKSAASLSYIAGETGAFEVEKRAGETGSTVMNLPLNVFLGGLASGSLLKKSLGFSGMVSLDLESSYLLSKNEQILEDKVKAQERYLEKNYKPEDSRIKQLNEIISECQREFECRKNIDGLKYIITQKFIKGDILFQKKLMECFNTNKKAKECSREIAKNDEFMSEFGPAIFPSTYRLKKKGIDFFKSSKKKKIAFIQSEILRNDIRKKLLYSDSSSQDPVVKTLVKKISKGEYDAEDLGLRYPVETFLQELDNALFDNTLKEFLN